MAYSTYYNSIQQSIVQRYLGMIREADIKHAPLISNLLTEELFKSEITPYLPEGLHISKGEVIKGIATSGDCDLIIYRKPVYDFLVANAGTTTTGDNDGVFEWAEMVALYNVLDRKNYRSGVLALHPDEWIKE